MTNTALDRAYEYLQERGWTLVAMVTVGSQLHGTAGPDSDADYVVVYNERPEDMLWPQADRAFKGKETKVGGDTTYFSLPHFLHLLEKGSPNAWEALTSNLELADTPVWADMQVYKNTTVSYALLRGMLGHAYSSFKTSQSETNAAKKAKAFAHAVRLLSQVMFLWTTNEPAHFEWPLPNADLLKRIKFQGEYELTEEDFEELYSSALGVVEHLEMPKTWEVPDTLRYLVMQHNLDLLVEYGQNQGMLA